MSKKRRLIYKDIDALRLIAVVPIIIFCLFYLMDSYKDNVISVIIGGLQYVKMASIEFFFFLSSFLLTAHALREYKYLQKFNLRHFYTRRALKILPQFLILVLFTLLILPWILNILQLSRFDSSLFYDNLLQFGSRSAVYTPEQFLLIAGSWFILIFCGMYFLLGVIFKLFQRKLKTISYVLIGFGLADRAYHILIKTSFEFDFFAYLVPIGIGIFFGDFVRNHKMKIDALKEIPKATNLMFYAIGISSIVGGYFILKGTYFSLAVPLILSLFFGYVIIDQTYGKHSFIKLRNYKILSKAGRMSYGLFTYTMVTSVVTLIALESLELQTTSMLIQILFLFLSLVIGIAVASFSYYRIEKPLGAVKREFKKF
ncbi:MAG: peptidoglycan/LPS O-acetylase OafA/YrhL [Arenicella sp.]|jgi:peptidoglycan/LPS O-acetylase OafA/YrhL